MLCPVDGTSVLVMTERQGIEIDYCPTCRGVWLDRGELDKIIERAAPDVGPAEVHRPAPPSAAAPPPEVRSFPVLAKGSVDPRYPGRSEQPRKKKKSSFLSELFEL